MKSDIVNGVPVRGPGKLKGKAEGEYYTAVIDKSMYNPHTHREVADGYVIDEGAKKITYNFIVVPLGAGELAKRLEIAKENKRKHVIMCRKMAFGSTIEIDTYPVELSPVNCGNMRRTIETAADQSVDFNTTINWKMADDKYYSISYNALKNVMFQLNQKIADVYEREKVLFDQIEAASVIADLDLVIWDAEPNFTLD